MEQVRVLDGGIVKIPDEFRRKLKLQDGDKAVFTEDSKGNIITSSLKNVADSCYSMTIFLRCFGERPVQISKDVQNCRKCR